MCKLYNVFVNVHILLLAFPKLENKFLHTIKSYQYSELKRLTTPVVFPSLIGFYSYGLPYMVYCLEKHLLHGFRHYSFCIDTVKFQ